MRLRVLVVAIFCAVCSVARADAVFTLVTGPLYRYPLAVLPSITYTWTLPLSPTPVSSGTAFFLPGLGFFRGEGDSPYFEEDVTFTAQNPIVFGADDADGDSFVTFLVDAQGDELDFETPNQFFSGPASAPTFLPGTYTGFGGITYGGIHAYSAPDIAFTIQSTPTTTPEPSGLVLLGTGLVSGCMLLRRSLAARAE